MSPLKPITLAGADARDDRGLRIYPLAAAGLTWETVENLHVLSLAPGATRGGHYHEHAREWIFIFSGPARISWWEPGGEETHTLTVAEGEPAFFEIYPRTAHSVHNPSDREIFLVAFNDRAGGGTISTPPLLGPAGEETP